MNASADQDEESSSAVEREVVDNELIEGATSCFKGSKVYSTSLMNHADKENGNRTERLNALYSIDSK